MKHGSTDLHSAVTGDDSLISSAILIIGCPPDFNEELTRKLAHETREVLAARTGHDGMELLRNHRVVLIVLNVGLPDMDARELFTGLRESHRTAAIPVLFLGQRISDSVKNHPCRTGSDGDMEGAASPDQVATWVASRLRRTRETVRVARRDPPTGLPSRAAFCDDFAEACTTCHATREPIALAVLSVDEYAPGAEAKERKTKDEIAPKVASVLSACLRATDVVARWSNEEFVVLLAGEDAFGATRAVEKALAAWRDFVAADCGRGLAGVTVSAGLTIVTPETPVTTAVTDAERYLYRAKAGGGNRVVSSHSQLHRRADRALIVIDDRLMALVIKRLLENEEIEVSHVRELDQALDACTGRQRFQLIVVDEKLQEQDGFNALERIKQLPRNHNVPTIMLLAEKTEERVTRALELGADDYAFRPFAALPFVSRVRELMERARPKGEPGSRSCRVLIVDNAADDLILAASALHNYGGFFVYLGRGAEDARSRLATLTVDILVAPLAMLETDRLAFGGATTEALHTDVAILATVVGDQYDQAYIAKHHIKGVLKKPFDPLKMGREIEQLMSISAAGRPSGAPPDHLGREIQRVLTLSCPDDNAASPPTG